MSVGPRIAVSLRQPKVYDIHRVMMTAQTDQEIVRLDVPMDEALYGNNTKEKGRVELDYATKQTNSSRAAFSSKRPLRMHRNGEA